SITKYNAQLQALSRYTSTLGKIYNIDVLDPFKILIFNKQFVRMSLLDNQLSILGKPIFLPDINIQQPLVACKSAEQSVWIIDAYKQELLQYDLARTTTRKYASLSTYTNNGEYLPNYAIERSGKLYVNFANNSVVVFDKFGTFLHIYAIVIPQWFEVHNNQLYYLANKKLYSQNLLNQTTPPVVLGDSITACTITENNVWIYKSGEISEIKLR
ncbi:MAG: hypothetical protein ACRC3G_03905, partial [Bacteroidales bacterium]